MMFVIYGQPHCSYCTRAKALLEEDNLQYKYIELNNAKAFDEFNSYFPMSRNVPQILLLTPNDGDYEFKRIGGYEDLVAYLK